MASVSLWSELVRSLEADQLSEAQYEALMALELADSARLAAWGIEPEQVKAAIGERWQWLKSLAHSSPVLPLPAAPMEAYLPLLWQFWLPLALKLKRLRAAQARPLIYGLLGGQGTGKTTLSLILQQLLAMMGLRLVGFSIDDIYKTYAERQQLRQRDPRLIWRGPPGTHDISLGIDTLQRVRQARSGEAIEIPRFDKSLFEGQGDRRAPETVEDIDVLLFEGWFLGSRPLMDMDWKQAPEPIRTAADRQFAEDMNRQLREYLPLWDLLDQLMVLIPEDYRLSQQWRLQAEQQMKATGKSGMSDEAVKEFVQYFWKALHPELFIEPLQRSKWVNLVVKIGADRLPRAIYAPEHQAGPEISGLP